MNQARFDQEIRGLATKRPSKRQVFNTFTILFAGRRGNNGVSHLLQKENRREEGLLVRAEPLEWAQQISQRMVDVVRVEDGALLLDVDPEWPGHINTVLIKGGLTLT